MADELRFLCDEMLAGLGRWLRIVGYDTAIAARGCRDRDLVEQAHAEQRILLTRDRRLVEIRHAHDRTVVLQSHGIDACARDLGRRLAIDWALDLLTRCTLCNTRLERADHRLLAFLPPRIHAHDAGCMRVLAVATSIGKAAMSAASAGGSKASRTEGTTMM